MTIIPERNEDRYIQHPLGNYKIVNGRKIDRITGQ